MVVVLSPSTDDVIRMTSQSGMSFQRGFLAPNDGDGVDLYQKLRKSQLEYARDNNFTGANFF